MLRIVVPELEIFDEETNKFVTKKGCTLQLEHSLLSVSKWESKWKKPFLSKEPMTDEETLDYVRCMTITQNVDPEVYQRLTTENINEVQAYIQDPMTATTFSEEEGGKSNREVITSEIIYYWMIAHNIPIDREKWHLNRLLTLIRVCNIKNSPPKKRNKRDMLRRRAELNAARKKRLGTRG